MHHVASVHADRTTQFRLLPVKVGLLLLVVAICTWLMPFSVAQAATCGTGGITGAVFRDYNANGVRENTPATFVEPGLAGIVVTAFSADGSSSSCESKADGSYAIDPAAGGFPVRLEFTLPTNGSMNFLKPGTAGRSTVVFVDNVANATGVDVGFNNPANYCGATTGFTMVTTCMSFGEQVDTANGVNRLSDALVAFPYTAGGNQFTDPAAISTPARTTRAMAKDIGAAWGIAYNPTSNTVYASAYMKRHIGFGPLSAGAIYQINAAGVASQFFVAADAGADPHPAANASCSRPGVANSNGNCWFYDDNAFNQVGKISYGDIDISDDFKTLYAINLATQSLLSIPIANPTGVSSVAVPTPSNCSTRSDVRPFGLGVNDGVVYVGVVCSAESTNSRNNLRAYVYAFNGTSFVNTPVLEFPLAYARGSTSNWNPWLNETTYEALADATETSGKYPQPMLSDITFDNGNMVLAFRDRNADQLGTRAGHPNPQSALAQAGTLITGFAKGDIVRACGNATSGWVLENDGSCGGIITGGAGGSGGAGGGGEYYFQDFQGFLAGTSLESETTFGAVAQVPGLPDVVSTIYNPIEVVGEVSDGGIKWYNNASATVSRSYRVYDATATPAFFAKANGLGDLEALCPGAPLEIGNRVWRDLDNDGVQDPNEPGIASVILELYKDGQLVGTVITDQNGNFIFNNGNVDGGIMPCSGGSPGYEIRITPQQAALFGLLPVLPNGDPSANGDLRDSDGSLVNGLIVFTVPCGDIAGPGSNNHTYDFGFSTALPHSLGNYVWIDANNDGKRDAPGEIAVPDGVVVQLLNADGSTVLSTTTTSGGFYLFSNLISGTYKVRLAASNFAPGGLLVNYTSSTGINQEANPDTNGDQNDNGLDGGNPTVDGITTGMINLGENEPTGETPTANGTPGNDGQDTPDANSNLTVDLGVVPPPLQLHSLGNYVWIDANNDGKRDPAEVAVPNGVVVQLLNADGSAVLSTTTTSGGFYLFSNLISGTYKIRLAASNFAAGGLLVNYTSSTGANQEAAPDSNGDQNDNGLDGSNPAVDGITSGMVTLSIDEPTAETPTANGTPGNDGAGTLDGNSNLTVDLGVVPPATPLHSLGNYVWIDTNNDGKRDPAEGAVPNGVVVQLLNADGSAVLSTTTTTNGFYLFSNLISGTYKIRLAASNFAAGGLLANYSSSTGVNQEANPDSNGDQNDNGLDGSNPAVDGISSGMVTLGTDEPTAESPTANGTPGNDGSGTVDANSNLTVDLGVIPPAELVAIGNVVFLDPNDNGKFEPALGETGINGVAVALFKAGDNPLTATPVATTTTSGGGFYLFDNVTAGQYFVFVQVQNFQSGAVLEKWLSSKGSSAAENVDDNSDENGIDEANPATNGVRSIVYNLQPNTLPIAEPGAGSYPGALDDNNVNFTADFGFRALLSLGNRIWRDGDKGLVGYNNGIRDNNEAGIANVVVNLLNGNGQPVLDANGQPITTKTDANGYYCFDNLLPGNYIVEIDKGNFLIGGPLDKLVSTLTVENDPNTNLDNTDNGIDSENPGVTGIRSGVVTLTIGGEPTNETDIGPTQKNSTAANNNLTVDFGLIVKPQSLDGPDEPQVPGNFRVFLPITTR